MGKDVTHPIEEVYSAIRAAFQRCEMIGCVPVREIDLLTELRANPALIRMACEVKDARAVIDAKRVNRAWKWAAWVLAALAVAGVLAQVVV